MNLSPDNFIALIISSFGIIFCLIVGIQVFTRKEGVKQTNVILGLLLVLYSLTLMNGLMAMTGVYAAYQHLYFLPLVFTLWIGPLFYFFVRSRIDSTFQVDKKSWVHFILPCLQLLFYLIVSVQSSEMKSHLWRNLISPYIQYIEEFLVIVSCIGYITYSIIIINRLFNNGQRTASVLKWLKNFALALLFLLLISSVYEIADWILYRVYEYNLFNTAWLDFPLKISYAIISWLIGYHAYIHQNQELIIKPVFEKQTDNVLYFNVTSLLNEQQVYLDPELNLDSFSRMLNTSKNNISQYFSSKDQSFRGAINQKRVEHFLKLVHEGKQKEMSLLGLAYESGFNSKASFNRIFKEQKGLSPSKFIQSQNI